MMFPIEYVNLDCNGDLYQRATRNYDRLETEEYQVHRIFRESGYSWPGDWEGRTILALVMLAQATQREPRYLDKIMEQLPTHLNDKGYFGAVVPKGIIDEQTLSGHSWFLRAMAEYHLWRKDELSLKIIEGIVRELLLSSIGGYENYPVNPEDRQNQGEAIGARLERRIGNWQLSTDVGCAFIMLDGATQAYQLLKWPELAILISEMITKFQSIDIVGLSFQTHATLSALRGILRHYESTGQQNLLELAENIFNLYINEGMTENSSNYNWFNRPEWTEPCAIVDSYIVAISLWKHTRKPIYLETGHHIMYNGLGYGQRPNGGFGCDVCSGAHDVFLNPYPELYEASWCCTMRGGDGLANAISCSYFIQPSDNRLFVPFFHDSVASIRLKNGELLLRQETAYPVEGTVRLKVEAASITESIQLCLYLPSWVHPDSIEIRVNGISVQVTFEQGFVHWTGTLEQGTEILYAFPILLRTESTNNVHTISGKRRFFHGPMLLGVDSPKAVVELAAETTFSHLQDATYQIDGMDAILTPIHDLFFKSHEEAKENIKQILFSGN